MLVWLYFRCQDRIARGNKPVENTERMNGLTQMIHLLMDEPTRENQEHLNESLIAMCDLTDDENSPRWNFNEQQVRDDLGQAYQGFQVGMHLCGHLRNPNSAQRDEAGSDSSEVIENAQQRYERYATSNLSEVSDPAEWLDMRGQSANDDDDQML